MNVRLDSTDPLFRNTMAQQRNISDLTKKLSSDMVGGKDVIIGPKGEVDLTKHYKVTQSISQTSKDIIIAEEAASSMDPKITTIDKIQNMITELHPYCQPGFTPSSEGQIERARIDSGLILHMIADALDQTVVNQDAIRNGMGVVNADGSANTDYVILKDQVNTKKLSDGTEIKDPLVPEFFANAIAAMQALRNAADNGVVGTAFSADIAPLYSSGAEDLMAMRSEAIYMKDIANDAADDLTQKLGEKKDDLTDMTSVDQLKASQEIQEANSKYEIVQAMMQNAYSTTASIIAAVKDMMRSY